MQTAVSYYGHGLQPDNRRCEKLTTLSSYDAIKQSTTDTKYPIIKRAEFE